MDWVPKIENASRDVTTPFQGRFVVRRLGLATINWHTKYEVSMFTNYEDMKGDEKCKKWGGLGGQGSPNAIRNIII